jgi:hypothetical protein
MRNTPGNSASSCFSGVGLSACFSLSSVFFVAMMLCGLLSSYAAEAQTVINYPNGFNSAAVSTAYGASGTIWLNNATQGGSQIQLSTVGTDHGAANAWFRTPANIQAFTTTFTFQIECSGGSSANCANGMGFMIICACIGGNPVYNPPGQPGFTYSGFSGNQFSWSQCSGVYSSQTGFPTTCVTINSILVKFDTFNITTGAFGSSLTGFCSGGIYCEPPQNVSYDMAPSGINLTSGDVFSATLTYDGSTLSETLTDTSTGAQYTKAYTGVNLSSLISGSTAFVGFGAGTGDTATQNSYLNSWTYTVGSPAQAAAPTFSPAGGTYSGPQSVTLSTATSPAVICYNTTGTPATNGSTGCATGTMNTGPITVSSNETLYAIAGGTGYSDSAVSSATYVMESMVATPTFSPAAGSYTTLQSVTISDATSNATIYYTIDGTMPTTSSTRYTGSIAVGSTETLKAIAVATGDITSAVASAAYAISQIPVAATPIFSPAGGSYSSAQSVTISDATSGATIYYTMDGTTPSPSSTMYLGPVTVGSTETLKAVAVVFGYTNSGVASAAYTISSSLPLASTPEFSPVPGTYSSGQSVTISDATSNATIYYTTDGTTPTTSSTEYTGPIAVSSTETLEAIAAATGDANSGVAYAPYTVTVSLPVASTPVFSPAAGAYSSPQSVTVSDATSGATIYYTTNGTVPTTSSTKYSGPITVSSTETLEAIAAAGGDTNSAAASAAYTINSSLPSVSTPAFSPAPGSYSSDQSVTISDATSDAIIYYTTDGTTPTTSSNKYSGPIMVSSTETLQAIAADTSESAIASGVYTITSTSQPNFMLATSSSSLTVDSGGQGTVTLTVTPVNGFSAPVILACTGLPAGASCSFGQATVTPSGGAATTQLVISASPQSSALRPASPPLFPMTALAVTVCFFGWRRRRAWHRWLLLAVAYAGLGLLFGCSASNGNSGTPTSANPASTSSTVTLTAISGTLQENATIALTIN